MLRFFALPATLILLSSCQMTDSVSTTTTREERLALAQTVIDDCRRSECGRLNLDSQLIEDYSPIAAMTHVKAFMTSYTDFNDLSAIAPMTQLRELHIGSTDVTDLSGLSGVPNLRLLHAQGLFVDDFSPIGQLRNLEELALGSGNVGDLSFIGRLSQLQSLNLDNATITSLAAMRGHPSLERLDLVDTNLPDDISVLLSLPKLRSLSVSSWSLSVAQGAVIDQLRANGVTVEIEPAVVVC